MLKKVTNLTTQEEDEFCFERRKEFIGKTPQECCKDCPLRWGNHCVRCYHFMHSGLSARMYKAIGDRLVEIKENKNEI